MNAGIHCKYVHLIDMACPRAVTLYLKNNDDIKKI